jgi:antitoxin HicB
MKKKHLGEKFDHFLQEDGIHEEVRAVAVKRIIAFQIEQEMKRRKFTKAAMARRMDTSRAALDRLLQPSNSSVTLATLNCAATALGKKLKIELV